MEYAFTISTLSFSLVFIGMLIGLILGLTGSGGSLMAVPLLVVLLSIELPEAIGISLAVVAFSALVGVFHHIKNGLVLWVPTIIFAVVGSASTPLGYLLGQYLMPLEVMILFGVLTIIIATLMWKKSQSNNNVLRASVLPINNECNNSESKKAADKIDNKGFYITRNTILAAITAAAVTGVLSGLLGVGGGFIIVPALTLLLKMSMRQAVASSLVIISIISSVGFYQYLVLTPIINTHFMSYLMIGSAVGMGLGVFLSRYISGRKLQEIFAVSMVLMSVSMLLKHVL